MARFYTNNFYAWHVAQVGKGRLEEYYQVPEVKLDLVRLNEHDFKLTLRHTRSYLPPNIARLPTDVLRHISSFLTCSRRIDMIFACPNDYPFIAPRWALETSTVARYKVLEAIFQHNYAYTVPGNWCMQSMVTDILQMVLRVLPILEDKST